MVDTNKTEKVSRLEEVAADLSRAGMKLAADVQSSRFNEDAIEDAHELSERILTCSKSIQEAGKLQEEYRQLINEEKSKKSDDELLSKLVGKRDFSSEHSALDELMSSIDQGFQKLSLERMGLHKKLPDTSNGRTKIECAVVPDFWALSSNHRTVTIWGDGPAVNLLERAVHRGLVRHSTSFANTSSDFEAIAQCLQLTFTKYKQPPWSGERLERAMKDHPAYDNFVDAYCQASGFNDANVSFVKRAANRDYDPTKPLSMFHLVALVSMVADWLRSRVPNRNVDIGLGICYKSQQYGGIRVHYVPPIATSLEKASDIVWMCNPGATISKNKDEASQHAANWSYEYWAPLASRGVVQFHSPLLHSSTTSDSQVQLQMTLRKMAEGVQDGMRGRSADDFSTDQVQYMLGDSHSRCTSSMSWQGPEQQNLGAIASETLRPPTAESTDTAAVGTIPTAPNASAPGMPIMAAHMPPIPNRLSSATGLPPPRPAISGLRPPGASASQLMPPPPLPRQARSSPNLGAVAPDTASKPPSKFGKVMHSLKRQASKLQGGGEDSDDGSSTTLIDLWDQVHNAPAWDIGPPGADPTEYEGGHMLSKDGVSTLTKQRVRTTKRKVSSQESGRKYNYRGRGKRVVCMATTMTHKGPSNPKWTNPAEGCDECKDRKRQCIVMANERNLVHFKGDYSTTGIDEGTSEEGGEEGGEEGDEEVGEEGGGGDAGVEVEEDEEAL